MRLAPPIGEESSSEVSTAYARGRGKEKNALLPPLPTPKVSLMPPEFMRDEVQ
jgi:hypothetical protein